MSILSAHNAARAGKGPLKRAPAGAELKAAIAELQAHLAQKDPKFKPGHDFRPAGPK